METDDWIVHLTEIRKRLLLVGVWFILVFAGGLYISPNILLYMKHQPLVDEIVWNVFSFTDGLFIYMKCAMVFALLFTLPVALHQLWSFVRPGLTDKEARGSLPYIPAAFCLFLIGVSFSYWVVFPMMVNFMKKMNHAIGAVETYGIDHYFSFLFNIVIPMAIAFELPVILLFLTRIGLLTPERLRFARKYAYVGLAIVGSCISPPDMISHLSVTVPLIGLFEISVFICCRQWNSMQSSPAGG